jgi:hypothetical protein
MLNIDDDIETVRASRAGHTFHERWAARRALQLVFPNDDLFAIAVEGISSTETAKPGAQAEEVADLVLYYGRGDNFQACERLETVQFKYKVREEAVTASYLKKTIEKFSDTILGYEQDFSAAEVNKKASFIFVTNAEFKDSLWEAIKSLIEGATPSSTDAATQFRNLKKWCAKRGLSDAGRLFTRVVFRAGERSLAAQDNALKRTLTDWSAGADLEARGRILGLQELVLKKAGPSGQGKNLIHREDVLDALDCEPEDLFPAETRFIDVGEVVERIELSITSNLVKETDRPVFVHAEGGVGKTVFVQSLAAMMASEFEVVVFDCFGGGSYRSDNHARHLPKIGLVQIVNELASRTLCDPMLPGGDDSRKVIKAACKRFSQAAAAIRTQSSKLGLLIIIDAADNAQLEADDRHEESFPKRLLAALDEEPIDGVKLLLTARPYRKDKVIDRARVSEIELGPFSDPEAREFLKSRKQDASEVEIATALARSGRNARVLDYLVQTWSTNVLGEASITNITVPEIIAQRCSKIISDLHIAGWPDSEITEFFVALSLLPPPIPLEELARALGWSVVQVRTAASDLAPMLENTSHGAIFRDEPTESYIRETFSDKPDAQRAIADRLLASQAISTYAAEALPHFLVVIKDSDRAFALADSVSFPSSVQSEFGRRRLTLARLRAAFRLAVAEDDFDRVLGLSMRLGQVATANMRGDEFIRRSPALAIVLGDSDSYRRLFADRSGWRGARSARLTVAHRFAGDSQEAQIQCESAIRWINWHSAQLREETHRDLAGPEVGDYSAVLFHHVVQGELSRVDHNLTRWNDRFSMSASNELFQLLELLDQASGTSILSDFVSFTVSKECTSQALKLQLLSQPRHLRKQQVRLLANAIVTSASHINEEVERSPVERSRSYVVDAALTTLFHSSRAAAAAIIRHTSVTRPAAYEYNEHFGHSSIWGSILSACISAWSAGRRIAYHDLLPREVKVNRQAKAVSTKKELQAFLNTLREPIPEHAREKGNKKKLRAKFSDRDCEGISRGIELARELTRPIEDAVLSRTLLREASVNEFLQVWQKHLRNNIHWRAESAVDLLARSVGFGCMYILLEQAPAISAEQAATMIDIVSTGRFSVQQKVDLLGQLSHRSNLHALAGEFAQHVAEVIRQDDNIGQRGDAYVTLAASLMPMSIDEAREYYRQGLAQLDQLGGESYELIYSLLEFATAQKGGFLKPELAQRLMNLCQTIASSEPRKFGWTVWARAAAQSIGFPAMAKLVRWHDQDVADLSYGMPQLACFLAKNRNLDPRRAAFILTLCEDHGWWDWRSGDGVADLLKLTAPQDQRKIYQAIVAKLKAEYPLGGWPSIWEGFLETGNQFPSVITLEEREEIQRLWVESKRSQDDFNSRNSSSPTFRGDQASKPNEVEIDDRMTSLVSACDPTSASSIDSALKFIQKDEALSYADRQIFISRVSDDCPYPKRLAFLFAVCDAAELGFTQSLDILKERFAAWGGSSTHLASHKTAIVERLFESKSVELFEDQFSKISRDIRQMSDFCGDNRFVLRLLLRKVAADEVELGGEEWIQLSTSLCDVASGKASLDSLEFLLSGPAARIADEIGEGPLRPEQEVTKSEAELVAELVWHLLGSEDAYVRWAVARALNTLIELGLTSELCLLLDRFDQREIAYFSSPERKLSYQNSQQWLLMGLARVATRHSSIVETLRPRLLALSQRHDLHVIHKVHIARCPRNASGDEVYDTDLKALLEEINNPPGGIIVSDVRPIAISPTSGFEFDYEFTKHDIDTLARLFNVSKGVVQDAIAAEIMRRWPEAVSMDYFPGRERRHWDHGSRFELYREHVQRHALLSAATSLAKILPVVVRSYDAGNGSPWQEWRDRYDITFDDGSWLSDHKDPVPEQAKENLLGERVGRQEVLQDQGVVLRKLGYLTTDSMAFFPLYGRWSSPDGVTVKVTSALTEKRGAIGRCGAFAKQPSHELWLPEFWDDGYYDRRSRQESPFAPLVWAPEVHSLGIDVGDEIAAEGAGGRPRLGVDLTKRLGLVNALGGEWRTKTGCLALRSQVWGSWKPDPDSGQSHYHEDGEILWASPEWLAMTLSTLNRQLVFTVRLWKSKSSRDYTLSSEVKSILVGLRSDAGSLRLWPAKKASKNIN